MSKTDKLYRLKAVAEKLCCGKSTVWYYSKKGLLHPKKLSDRVTVWTETDINNFIQSRIHDEVAK